MTQRCENCERLRAALAGVLNCIGNLEVTRDQWLMIRDARHVLDEQSSDLLQMGEDLRPAVLKGD
jgi:hypothetical protein